MSRRRWRVRTRLHEPRPDSPIGLVAVRRLAWAALAIVLLNGTGQPAPALGAKVQAIATVPEIRPPVIAVTPRPRVLGAVADSAGQLWARTDIGGTGALEVITGRRDEGRGIRADVTGGTGWWMPGGPSGTRWIPIAWPAEAGDVTMTVWATLASGETAAPVSVEVRGDAEAPVAELEPLAVEQGGLVLRWDDADGSGSGIVERSVRIETAPATATGCGAFSLASGMVLDPAGVGGSLALGRPPSSGCVRASLVLTDRVGLTSVTTGLPYRIQPAAPAAPATATPRWSGRFNLFRPSAFVTQKTFRWCVAASVQMMVNLVRNHTDRTAATQRRVITYAQRWDNGPYGVDGGTDVTGWTTALRHFGAGRYRAVGASTAERALRIAATAMRQTGRPAGILVMEGRHAWVLHGFESRTDPRADRRAVIRAVRISGPLYPVQQNGGYDPRPNTRLTIKALKRYFQPSSVGTLAGKYVVVIPTH